MKTPVVIINLKTYPQATGEKAVLLAQACERVSNQYDVPIVVAPQIPDVYRVAKAVEIPVFSQHMDAGEPGRFTGHALGETLVEAGCAGTLLNHSEKRMQLADIETSIVKSHQLNLYAVVCTNNIQVSVAAATMNPWSVAVEPPELIGSGISVSQAQPEIISGTVEKIRAVNKDVVILCGAGISNGDDVKSAIKLGAQGVLLASAVATSPKPEDVLSDLVTPLSK
ncbi:triose-phosphate isomerase [Candidatus Thorarchaeota archaeon]|nr:MAG: triose-phosphate isomerase [Candidatus Thorarchaeota archaeon]